MEPPEFNEDTILSELSEVVRTWPRLAAALDIEQEIHTKIGQECQGDAERACLHIIKHWLDNDPDASWKKLAEGLLTQQLFRTYGSRIYSKYISKDFTVRNVISETKEISDIFELAYPLLFESNEIKRMINLKNLEDSQRREYLMNYWMNFDPSSSWEKLARQYSDCLPRHRELAERIRSKYIPPIEVLPLYPEKPFKKVELRPDTAFEETSPIEDWYALGWFLGLDEDELAEIESDRSRSDECRLAVLKQWLVTDKEEASWLKLGQAIQHMPQHLELSEDIMRTLVEKVEEKQEYHREQQDVALTQDIVKPVPATTKAIEDENVTVLRTKIASLQEDLNALTSRVNEQKSMLQLFEKSAEFKDKQIQRLRAHAYSPLPSDITDVMEVIAEYHGEFMGDTGYTLPWSDYGFNLYIPKGSLPAGEIGRVNVHAIYGGPLQLPTEGASVSAFYCVTVSHELLKPATIEIQHCVNIANEDIIQEMTFMSASLSSGPPYVFDALDGGHFSVNSNYATLKRSTFSIFGVFLKKVRSLFTKHLREEVRQPREAKKRRRDSEEDVASEGSEGFRESQKRGRNIIQYSCFYLLVNRGQNWMVRIFVTQNLTAHFKHVTESQPHEIVLAEDFDVVLKSKNIVFAVTRGDKPHNSIIEWTGERIEIGDWMIYANQPKINRKRIEFYTEKQFPPSVTINFNNSSESPSEQYFYIHMIGFEEDLKFMIVIPYNKPTCKSPLTKHGRISKEDISIRSSSINDEPELLDFMNNVAENSFNYFEALAVKLLPEEKVVSKFLAEHEASRDTIYRGFMKLFEMWKESSVEGDCSWLTIVNALKRVGNKSLANKIETYFREKIR